MNFTLHQEEDATVLRFEPSAMISAREGELNVLAAQAFIPASLAGAWYLGDAFGLTGEAFWAWMAASSIVCAGGAAMHLAMSAVRYSVKWHPRLALVGSDGHLIGFPGREEVVFPMKDIFAITIKRQRWAGRPWLRYSVIAMLEDGREVRLTPSVLRRNDASDLAAALIEWTHHPKEFTAAVVAGKGHEYLDLVWEGYTPDAAIDNLAA